MKSEIYKVPKEKIVIIFDLRFKVWLDAIQNGCNCVNFYQGSYNPHELSKDCQHILGSERIPVVIGFPRMLWLK